MSQSNSISNGTPADPQKHGIFQTYNREGSTGTPRHHPGAVRDFRSFPKVLQRRMPLQNALEECLTYIRGCVPPFDDELLQTPLQLPGWNPRYWGPVLDSAPSTVALRSAALQSAARFLVDFNEYDDQGLAAGLEVFRKVRRDLSTGHEASVYHPDLHLHTELSRLGALVIMEPSNSLSDGAARVASHGYFDNNNIPPWDTWITTVPPRPGGWGSLGLLCWVPKWARQHVEDAIAVNPEECLHWADIQGEQAIWR